MEAARGQPSELFPGAEDLLGLVRNMPAAVSPIHPEREMSDPADGNGVQPNQDSATVQQVAPAEVTGPLGSSLWPVQKLSLIHI